ncbi:hypothetical protein BX265_1580 [Streptomyces sp. TLI_235]|nr:hypothetical protein [Streptomyces sp. TLI_235]PBC76859.1 hypothetical protein BX265_1580 [Streptomyces sp. TLI_235]
MGTGGKRNGTGCGCALAAAALIALPVLLLWTWHRSTAPPDVAALARSRPVAVVDEDARADMDRRLTELTSALPGAVLIGDAVDDGCGATARTGFAAGYEEPSCTRDVIRYLALADPPPAAVATVEAALTAHGWRPDLPIGETAARPDGTGGGPDGSWTTPIHCTSP